jgi:hypothetical protein
MVARQTAAMDHRSIARISAAGRVAIGAALLAVPNLVTKGWTGDVGSTAGGKVLARALGARDLTLGLGVIGALDRGDARARDWIRASALSDTADAAATVLAYPQLPRRSRFAILALAVGAAAAGFVAAEHLD